MMDLQQRSDRTGGFSLPVFLGVALGGAWLVVVPMYLAGVGVAAAGMAMMTTPSIGVVVTWLAARRGGMGGRDMAYRTGLTFGPSKGRTAAVMLALLIGLPALSGITIAITAGFGLVRLAPGAALTALAMIPMSAAALLPTAFGEEWGWRGLMTPRLAVRYPSQLRLAIVSGAIWGLWHAPLGLYFGAMAPLYFIPLCLLFMVFAALLNLTRSATGSTWPAVLGHALLNASPVAVMTAVTDTTTTNIDGNGIAAMAVWAALLTIAVTMLVRRSAPRPAH